MSNSQFNTIVQMIAALSERVEVINQENQKRFATKEDLKRFATKEDLKKFATKKDLKKFTTKEDLKQYVTHDILRRELAKMAHEILDAMSVPFARLEKIVNENHEQRLKTLETALQQRAS